VNCRGIVSANLLRPWRFNEKAALLKAGQTALLKPIDVEGSNIELKVEKVLRSSDVGTQR
jgi:hypothetical protein